MTKRDTIIIIIICAIIVIVCDLAYCAYMTKLPPKEPPPLGVTITIQPNRKLTAKEHQDLEKFMRERRQQTLQDRQELQDLSEHLIRSGKELENVSEEAMRKAAELENYRF